MAPTETLKSYGWCGSEKVNQRAIFKAMCLSGVPTWRFKMAARRLGIGRQTLRGWFGGRRQPGSLLLIVDSTCRGCGKSINPPDFAIWHTYWTPMWAPCHAGCREAGMKLEAFDCQCIDSDCNDCRHFQRGVTTNPVMEPNPQIFMPLRMSASYQSPSNPATSEGSQKMSKSLGNVVDPNYVLDNLRIAGTLGNCLKFSCTVIANAMRASCNPCFEHRKG